MDASSSSKSAATSSGAVGRTIYPPQQPSHHQQQHRVSPSIPGNNYDGRLFTTKRAREIQQQEGVALPIWRSGSSEMLVASPKPSSGSDRDILSSSSSSARRARADTLPSRFSPSSASITSPMSSASPTPITPFRTPSMRDADSSSSAEYLNSRLRSGSLNTAASQRQAPLPFGPSIFSSAWNSRVVSSPAGQSNYSRDDEPQHTPVKTLDYLGLADSSIGNISSDKEISLDTAAARLNADMNRIRSYSVNAKEKYNETPQHQPVYNNQLYDNQVRPRAQTTANITNNNNNNLQVPSDNMQRYVLTPGAIENNKQSYFDEGQNDAGIGPTRALWLGNIPASTTSSTLIAIFGGYGTIESARVLTHKNCGFVNFERLDSAVQARALLHGKEIFPGGGPIRIGFAKVPVSPTGPIAAAEISEPITSSEILRSSEDKPLASQMHDEMVSLIRQLGGDEEELREIEPSLQAASGMQAFIKAIPAIPESSSSRVYDAMKLRELRKRIDSGLCDEEELKAVAEDMLDEIVELSSDYLGNTVVQKLFQFCPSETKELMIDRIAPHLAEIGIHKNGTWAAQKIIDLANTEKQILMITENIRPYLPSLFLDQFGNYVVQCCLRFGMPWNNMVFEAMIAALPELSHDRFGARAMRACLESHHTEKSQQRLLAAAISIHGLELSGNANGALLLTWLLDTCGFQKRHQLLFEQFEPFLAACCTHKLASLTILKLVNQRHEPDVQSAVINAIFASANDSVLQSILTDSQLGPSIIFKMLITPYIDQDLRQKMSTSLRRVLLQMKVPVSQPYKRLMDEVGLSTRGTNVSNGGSPARMESPARRPASRDAYSPYFHGATPVSSSPVVHNSPNGVDMYQAFEQLSLSGQTPYPNPQAYAIAAAAAAAAAASPQYQAMLQQQQQRYYTQSDSEYMEAYNPLSFPPQYGSISGSVMYSPYSQMPSPPHQHHQASPQRSQHHSRERR